MRAFSKRERPGVKEVTTNTTAPCSKSPKPTDTRTDLTRTFSVSLDTNSRSSRFPLPLLRFLKNFATTGTGMHRDNYEQTNFYVLKIFYFLYFD